jgi:hypothetical protein
VRVPHPFAPFAKGWDPRMPTLRSRIFVSRQPQRSRLPDRPKSNWRAGGWPIQARFWLEWDSSQGRRLSKGGNPEPHDPDCDLQKFSTKINIILVTHNLYSKLSKSPHWDHAPARPHPSVGRRKPEAESREPKARPTRTMDSRIKANPAPERLR